MCRGAIERVNQSTDRPAAENVQAPFSSIQWQNASSMDKLVSPETEYSVRTMLEALQPLLPPPADVIYVTPDGTILSVPLDEIIGLEELPFT